MAQQCRWARGGARRRHERHTRRGSTVASQRADGNGFLPARALTEAVAFGLNWTEATDQFLASGFISPSRFVEVVTELDLRPGDMPDDLRRRVFVLLVEAAKVGIRDLQVLLEDIVQWFAKSEGDDVRRIACSDGAGVNIERFAGW